MKASGRIHFGRNNELDKKAVPQLRFLFLFLFLFLHLLVLLLLPAEDDWR